MGSRIKKWNITGEVVPPGSLGPNPYNRYARLTAEERWESFVRACAEIIVDASKRQRKASEKYPEQNCCGGSAPIPWKGGQPRRRTCTTVTNPLTRG